MEVQLIIKSPYQASGDIKIDCDMLWSVGKVKEHLSSLYPGKPRKEDQKLIYCGRLLLDHLQLKDILNQAQSVHTMHLVYPFPVCLDGSGTQETKATSESSEVANVQSSFPSPVNGTCPDGIRQRTVGSEPAALGNFPMHPMYTFPQAAASSPASPVDLASQFTAMQQMYAQMMAQYFSQAQAGAANFQYIPLPQATPALTPQQPPASVPAAAAAADIQDQPANNNRLAYAPEQQPQNNADEEAAAQDLLDWIYIMSRTMILFTILYFYSSLHRVLLVVSLGVLFFVYRAGVFEGRQRRTPPQRPTNDQPNETQVPEANNDPAQNNNRAADNQVTPTEAREGTPAEEQAMSSEQVTRVPESQISVQSVISVAVTFVTTFFTSLIPEQPVPVNVN